MDWVDEWEAVWCGMEWKRLARYTPDRTPLAEPRLQHMVGVVEGGNCRRTKWKAGWRDSVQDVGLVGESADIRMDG